MSLADHSKSILLQADWVMLANNEDTSTCLRHVVVSKLQPQYIVFLSIETVIMNSPGVKYHIWKHKPIKNMHGHVF